MANWKKTNFNAVRDISPDDLPMQWRFARSALESPEIGVSRFTYEPGARMPWAHRHTVQQEVYVVGGRKPEGRDSERFPDPWSAEEQGGHDRA